MRYLFVFLLVLPLTVAAGKGGQSPIDSLKAELPKAKEDTNKIGLLNALSYEYYKVAPDSGVSYAHEALTLATNLRSKKGIASAYSNLGINYQAKAGFDTALAYHKKALELFEELGIKKNVASLLTNTAQIYSIQGDYKTALTYYFKALDICEAIHNVESKAMVLQNIGCTYLEEKNYSKAMEYLNAALAMYKQEGNEQNIAATEDDIGMVLNATGEHKAALEKFMHALDIHIKLGNKNATHIALNCIAAAYIDLADYTKALDYLQKALAICKEIGNADGIAIETGNMGEAWFKLATRNSTADKEALKNAIGYLSEGAEQCRKLNYVAPMIEFNEYLSNAYFFSGDYKKAYLTFTKNTAIKDSVFSTESKTQLAGMDATRQLALKDKDILLKQKAIKIKELELAKKKNDQVLYLVCLLLMLMVTVTVVRLFLRYRRSNSALQKEKQEHLESIKMHVERIKEQSDLLDEISHTQSHEVRGQVATILGLVHIFNKDDYADPSNQVVIDGIADVAHKLDDTIKDIVKKENKLGETD